MTLTPPPQGRGAHRDRGAVVHHGRSKLKAGAAADGARAPAFSAWGSSLRAAPVSWPPCARGGWLPPSRGSFAPAGFFLSFWASSLRKKPRGGSFSFSLLE